jgi:hypothetical protein
MGKLLSMFMLTILMVSCQPNNSDKTSYAVAEMDEEMIPKTRQSAEEPRPPVGTNGKSRGNKEENH